MIKENLSKMILESLKNKDTVRLEALRAIKAGIQAYETSGTVPKDDKGNIIYDDATEIGIIKSLIKQRRGDAETYENSKRPDLAEAENAQANIMEEFLPQPPSNEELTAAFNELCTTIEPLKKNMGSFVKSIKAKYPAADGKLVASIVSSNLK